MRAAPAPSFDILKAFRPLVYWRPEFSIICVMFDGRLTLPPLPQ